MTATWKHNGNTDTHVCTRGASETDAQLAERMVSELTTIFADSAHTPDYGQPITITWHPK